MVVEDTEKPNAKSHQSFLDSEPEVVPEFFTAVESSPITPSAHSDTLASIDRFLSCLEHIDGDNVTAADIAMALHYICKFFEGPNWQGFRFNDPEFDPRVVVQDVAVRIVALAWPLMDSTTLFMCRDLGKQGFYVQVIMSLAKYFRV